MKYLKLFSIVYALKYLPGQFSCVLIENCIKIATKSANVLCILQTTWEFYGPKYLH